MKNLNKLLTIIILVNVFLLLILNFFPYPELFVYPYLTAHGSVPYAQIFDQHFPGLMFLPVNLYTLGFTDPQSMRIIQVFIVIVNQILIYKVSGLVIKNKKFILLPNILYLIWQPMLEGYVLWIDTMVTPLVLLGFYMILLSKFKDLRKIFLAGLVLGVALTFKQILVPVIIVFGLAILLKTKRPKELIIFGVGAAIPALVMVLYFVSLGVWEQFYYWTFTFNVTLFAEFGRKFASTGEIIKIAPIMGLAFIIGLWLIYKRVIFEIKFLFAVFVVCLLFAYARFDFVHLQPALPFAVILLTIGFMHLSKKYFIPVAVGYILLVSVLMIRFYPQNIGGKVYFWDNAEKEIFDQVKSMTNSGDTIFAFATLAHTYAATNTLPPGKLFVFQFPWFMMETQDEILSGIKSDPPVLILREENALTDGKNLISYMKNINEFVKANYRLEKRVNGVEFWVKL
jgi:hypothetical protein